MKYATEMGLSAMIHIPGFIKTGSGILKLMEEEGLTHIQTLWRLHKHTLIFSK
jgi:hypothetical protein